jgi:chemotaxis protein CheZ
MTARLSGVSFGKHQDLITDVISGLQEMAAAEKAINNNLTQIMEAQAFRDVAGQMVKKIVDAAIEVESILLEILKEYAPDTKDSLISTEGLTAGPGLKTQSNVNGQDEVDDLLASLGL